MRAMVMRSLGEPEQLELVELPDPIPGAGEVRIDVEAAACNFADVLLCQGKYQVRPPLPFSPGSEVAGRVGALGPGVGGLAIGQPVFGLVGHGGFRSAVLAPANAVHPVPEGMPLAEAAGFGIAYQTSYLALCDRAHLVAGETLLVHAAAGGVGLAALQIGKALGARVIAGAGSDDKLEFCRAQGADEVVNTRGVDWADRVRELTGGRGADVIYDSVGGEVFELSTKCIAFGGRLLVIGFASGEIPSIKCNRIMLKHIAVIGLHLGGYRQHAPQAPRDAMTALFELYRQGKVRPLIGGRYPLEEAATALRALASRNTTGKLVLFS